MKLVGEAGQLKPGDRLAGETGDGMAVEEARDTGKYETVYSLRVAACHTCYVGLLA
jgi:hypothetical protein